VADLLEKQVNYLNLEEFASFFSAQQSVWLLQAVEILVRNREQAVFSIKKSKLLPTLEVLLRQFLVPH